jgi:hypothetical protein
MKQAWLREHRFFNDLPRKLDPGGSTCTLSVRSYRGQNRASMTVPTTMRYQAKGAKPTRWT